MRQIVVKEGPLILVERIIISEIFSAFVLYLISFLTNYEQFYRSTPLINILRYDIFLMVIFSLFQIFIILLLFIYWYFSYIEIGIEEVIKVRGIIKRKRNMYFLRRLLSVEVHQNILERKMNHASIMLFFDENKKLKIRNVGRFEEVEEILSVALQTKEKKKISLDTLISSGENDHLEFKETLRFDIRKNILNKDIEKASLKTIAGFLNNGGGMLLIGVDDHGVAQGLGRDYSTLKRQDRDGFHNYLTVLIKESLGARVLNNIHIEFQEKEKNDVCLVDILPAKEPIYLTSLEGKEEFFVRAGNTTQPLSMSETQNYIKQKWG